MAEAQNLEAACLMTKKACEHATLSVFSESLARIRRKPQSRLGAVATDSPPAIRGAFGPLTSYPCASFAKKRQPYYQLRWRCRQSTSACRASANGATLLLVTDRRLKSKATRRCRRSVRLSYLRGALQPCLSLPACGELVRLHNAGPCSACNALMVSYRSLS